MKRIEIIQGDVSPIFKFQRKYDNGEIITTIPKKMWITFKKNSLCDECLIQKTLDNGIIFEDNFYKFQILSEDTNKLSYGIYEFDIAILNEIGEKKTLLNDGVLEITKHYTKKCNEV